MDAEINFGELQHAQPQPGRRPDRNPLYGHAWVGDPTEWEPTIFVDLDVMQALESHAHSDTSVELGGVLLGRQHVDEAGHPFVTVIESIAAEHYHATRGSFKFTHQTWQTISRKREAYSPEWSMVGWYHTHPDWSVFLSGMDLFICDHFFNRPLDVALVIDPVRNDRGWFIWTGDPASPIGRTPGFCLFAHRSRQAELQQVAAYFNEVMSMTSEARARPPLPSSQPAQPAIVYLQDRHSALTGIAWVALVVVQISILALLLWRSNSSDQARWGALETQVSALTQREKSAAQAAAYREMLIAITERDSGSAGIVDRWQQADQASRQLRTSLDGYVAITEKLKGQLAEDGDQIAQFERQLTALQAEVQRRDAESQALRAQLAAAAPATDSLDSGWNMSRIAWIAGAVLVLAAATCGGYFLGRRHSYEA